MAGTTKQRSWYRVSETQPCPICGDDTSPCYVHVSKPLALCDNKEGTRWKGRLHTYDDADYVAVLYEAEMLAQAGA